MECSDVKIETNINASVDTVWSIISNFSKWSDWHKGRVYVDTFEGVPRQLESQMAGVLVRFNLNKVKVVEGQLLEWRGSLPLTGRLLNGTRRFTLIQVSKSHCKLTQEERFGGLLSGIFKAKLSKKYKLRYQRHNEKIKAIAESK